MVIKGSGFTLVELVTVIILLGILAAVALPRFINVSSDARVAAIEGVAGSLRSVDAMVMSRSMLDGTQNDDRSPTPAVQQTGFFLDGQYIQTFFGVPWYYDATALPLLMTIDLQNEGSNNANQVCNYSGSFCGQVFSGSSAPGTLGLSFSPGGALVIYFPNDSVADQCFAYHIFDRATLGSRVGTVTTGC